MVNKNLQMQRGIRGWIGTACRCKEGRKLQKVETGLQMRKRRSVMGKRSLIATKDKVADGEKELADAKHSLQMDRIRSVRRNDRFQMVRLLSTYNTN